MCHVLPSSRFVLPPGLHPGQGDPPDCPLQGDDSGQEQAHLYTLSSSEGGETSPPAAGPQRKKHKLGESPDLQLASPASSLQTEPDIADDVIDLTQD